MSLLSAVVLLFLVMNSLGSVPLFLSAVRNVPAHRQRWVVAREMLVALAVLVFFLFLGQYAMQALGLTQPALGVAGGVVLLVIAMRMVFPNHAGAIEEEVVTEPFIVPLAVPYIAGPSAIATVMLLMSRDPGRWMDWLLALVVAWSAGAAILLGGTVLQRILGERGLLAMERLMGLILISLAVQMLMDGIGGFLKLNGI